MLNVFSVSLPFQHNIFLLDEEITPSNTEKDEEFADYDDEKEVVAGENITYLDHIMDCIR